jgi:hypothetical protein
MISLFHLLFSGLSSEYKLVNRLDIFIAALGLRVYIKLFKYNWSKLFTKNYWMKSIMIIMCVWLLGSCTHEFVEGEVVYDKNGNTYMLRPAVGANTYRFIYLDIRDDISKRITKKDTL